MTELDVISLSFTSKRLASSLLMFLFRFSSCFSVRFSVLKSLHGPHQKQLNLKFKIISTKNFHNLRCHCTFIFSSCLKHQLISQSANSKAHANVAKSNSPSTPRHLSHISSAPVPSAAKSPATLVPSTSAPNTTLSTSRRARN